MTVVLRRTGRAGLTCYDLGPLAPGDQSDQIQLVTLGPQPYLINVPESGGTADRRVRDGPDGVGPDCHQLTCLMMPDEAVEDGIASFAFWVAGFQVHLAASATSRTASLSLLLSPLAKFARLGRQGSAPRGGSHLKEA